MHRRFRIGPFRNPQFTVLTAIAAVSAAASMSLATQQTARVRRTYHPNGVLQSEERFDKRDELHGCCRSWYDNGNLQREVEFCHGNWVHFSKAYAPDGTLQQELYEDAFYNVVSVYHAGQTVASTSHAH